MDCQLIYITASSAEEARKIARALVEERLAACANLLGDIGSIYWWEGAVQEDTEFALIVKSTAELVPSIVERVRVLHSYDCPCVVAMPITAGNSAFLEWIEAETN
ncbi:MAG: divalent-cation tolerance protein CutA [Alphaproteobacteria bacterium]|nr:divalent-cation tolerance protein CutA [Alphaproteobacteria bacterium]